MDMTLTPELLIYTVENGAVKHHYEVVFSPPAFLSNSISLPERTEFLNLKSIIV